MHEDWKDVYIAQKYLIAQLGDTAGEVEVHSVAFMTDYVKWLEVHWYFLRRKCSLKNRVLVIYHLYGDICKGTNQRLIYDFLLVINSNLPPTLHRFQVMVKFSRARGECLTLTLSLGVIPCQYRHKWYITFFPQKVSMYPQPSYRIRWNYAKVRATTPFKIIQGHRF